MQRHTTDQIIAGVCAGLAREMEINPVYVRLAFLLGFALWGIGPVIYLILWVLTTAE